MKRLDLLIIKEIVGPWLFGVALFGTLLFAGTYLQKVADFVAKGVPPDLIAGFAFLLIPAILVQTFAMSMLLASLLAFGRLSSDSEIVAIRAAGVSLFRIIAPVSVFAILVAAVAFVTNETIVPMAAKRSARLLDDIARKLDGASFKDTNYPLMKDGKLQGMMVAKDFVPSLGIMRGVTVIGYKETGPPEEIGNPSAYLYASEMEFDAGRLKDVKAWDGSGWRIRGRAEITRADGNDVIKLDEGAWPPDMPQINVGIGDL
ncbi:MAG: LptF/LptG family permease, partial [Chlorobia bacterium]|nr:LptF/LptG family permease [Fimbriimonadaceae bacterium]